MTFQTPSVYLTLALAHRRCLLLALGRLERLGRDLRGVHRDSGEARRMGWIPLHDQRIIGVLNCVTHLVPLLLLDEHHIVCRCRGQWW